MNAKPVCILTGGNTGIGYEVAQQLLLSGFRIILACRSKERGEGAVAKLNKLIVNESMGYVEFMELDLSQKASIENFAKLFISKELPLHLLVNNAAVYNSNSKPLVENTIDPTLYINFYGLIFLTHLLLPKLKESAPSRIVNLGSSLYEKASQELDQTSLNPCADFGLDPSNCYPISKLRVLMASAYIETYGLQDTDEITIVNVCPGFIPTTELNRDSSFFQRQFMYFVFPFFSFTSTLQQGLERVYSAITAPLKSLKTSAPSTLMYSKGSWNRLEFDEQKVKELWAHVSQVMALEQN